MFGRKRDVTNVNAGGRDVQWRTDAMSNLRKTDIAFLCHQSAASSLSLSPAPPASFFSCHDIRFYSNSLGMLWKPGSLHLSVLPSQAWLHLLAVVTEAALGRA